MRETAELNKLAPQAPELERAIIGAILLEGSRAMAEVADILVTGAFYVKANEIIFSAMQGMYGRSEDIDTLTLYYELSKCGKLDTVGGAHYISTLTDGVASSLHIQRHAMIVMEQYIAREAIRLNSEAMDHAYAGEDVLELIPETIAKMEASIAGSIRKRSISYAKAEESQLEAMNQPQRAIHSTGFDAMDKVIGGFHRGDLITIAARPAMGKTSLAFSMASLAADRGFPTGMLSMELKESTGQARLFSRKSGVPLADIVNNKLSDAQIQKRHQTLAEAEKWPLWIRYDGNMGLTDIRAEATRMKRQNDIGCIFIDQLNWIKPPKAANRDAAVGEITRTLKNIAMDLDVAMVLLHQLNREVERRGGDKRPQLSDLRDSGNVEQDSQLVLFPYRPEYYGITEDNFGSTIGLVEIIIAKNSNGPCETVRLSFDNPTASVFERPTPFYANPTF